MIICIGELINMKHYLIIFILLSACTNQHNAEVASNTDSIACYDEMPSRFAASTDASSIQPGNGSTDGMVWIEGGEFQMGAGADEFHAVGLVHQLFQRVH